MGCGAAFTIRMTEPLGEPGSYEIVATSDAGESRCTYALPLVSGAWDCGDLFVGFDGAGALAVIHSPRVRRLVVTITRDGVVVASKAFSPEYSFKELNGPGCGTCPFASDSL